MSERTQRDAFWSRVCRRAREDRDIVVISADMGAPALDEFRRDLARQFVNVGIAEANAVLVGAGLALAGKKVFAYAIAPFITLRCLEQVRVQMGIMNIPLALVGVGAGFSYEESGPTHHLLEDLAVMRSMPNLTIHSVTDGVMAEALADECCLRPRPRYIRMDRQPLPDIYPPGSDFSAGMALLREGADGLLVATGAMTHAALALAERLAGRGLAVGVLDLHTLPIDGDRLAEALAGARRLVTIEEHFLPGGLGGAVAEILLDRGLAVPLRRLGIGHGGGYSYVYGGRELIRKSVGLDLPAMERAVLDHLRGGD